MVNDFPCKKCFKNKAKHHQVVDQGTYWCTPWEDPEDNRHYDPCSNLEYLAWKNKENKRAKRNGSIR